MTRWIVLLRGVNVGGKHVLRSKDFVALLQALGAAGVATYLQSGNAVFDSKERSAAALAKKIGKAIASAHGFEPHVLALTLAQMQSAAADIPFAAADAAPTTVHLFFLESVPKRPNLARLAEGKAASEDFALKGKVFYLHTPEGFGTSKLAGIAERALGVPATARNWRTVTSLIELAQKRD